MEEFETAIYAYEQKEKELLRVIEQLKQQNEVISIKLKKQNTLLKTISELSNFIEE